MPAILPVTTTIVLIRIIEGFKIIDMPNILLGGGPGTATQSMTLQAYIDWNTLNLGRSAAVAYLLLILVTIVATVYVSLVRRRVTDSHERGMTNPFRRRSAADLSPRAKVVAFILLLGWSFVVLFPIYWLFVTSFKTPYQVDKGPFYIPFVDFQPTLDAWNYILFDLGNDTIRPYINTVIVGLSSSLIALLIGSLAAYALVRFTYRPRIGIIGLFIASMAYAFVVAGARRADRPRVRLGDRDLRDPRPDGRTTVRPGAWATATSRSG